MKKVLMITTGGTMASKETEHGLSPKLAAKELLEYVPELEQLIDISIQDILNIESSDLVPSYWKVMVKTIEDNYDKYDGFVVIHGTDTLAYTSSALSYMIQNPKKPIIVTGSQVPISNNISDAKKNLIDSCILAAKGDMNGVFVVFNGKIMFGNHVTKLRSKNYDAFDSINYPVIGKIDGGKVYKYIQPEDNGKSIKYYYDLNDKVLLIKFYPGINEKHYEDIHTQYKGVILENYGVGGIPRSFLNCISNWTNNGVVVIGSTQVQYDGTDLGRYTVGNEAIKKYGIYESGEMTVESVITKLMYALGNSKTITETRKLFTANIQNDMVNID
ncbi:MAG: asparaginase [Tissierellaceae bacterium]|nr:asparaginase [Tissierellaceae bacterium]